MMKKEEKGNQEDGRTSLRSRAPVLLHTIVLLIMYQEKGVIDSHLSMTFSCVSVP
jgi:hypothetical protein